jgi:predicted nucleic acid-binding protein
VHRHEPSGCSLERSYQSIFVSTADHILAFDGEAALRYGSLVADRERIGVVMDPMDAQIACIAICHGAAIATRNERDFADCEAPLVNPWRHRG